MRDVALSFTCAQTNNLFGKLLMWTTFAGVAFIRSTKDLDQYKELIKEVRNSCRAVRGAAAHLRSFVRLSSAQATFYDKQWSATWEGVDRPSEKEK